MMSVYFDEDDNARSRSEAPASENEMEAWRSALKAFFDAVEKDEGPMPEEAAAAITQQYGDQREAAGYRRGVEDAAKTASKRMTNGKQIWGLKSRYDDAVEEVSTAILALLETKEAG